MRLTRQEIILITSILAALVLGAAVKYHRDQTRLRSTAAAAAATHP